MKRQLMREMVGGESYEYVPLGKFVVSAPAICRGRPTFKDTRIEVAGVLARLAAGHTVAALITDSEAVFPARPSRKPLPWLSKHSYGKSGLAPVEHDHPGRAACGVRFARSHSTVLHPNTVIQDEAIPLLLRAALRPTFVTINVADFWRRLAPDIRFCIACFAVPHTQAQEVPDLLRRLFALEPFHTRSRRLGKIARVSRRHV